MAGQENTNDRAFKSFGKNLHKNHRGFVVIIQKINKKDFQAPY